MKDKTKKGEAAPEKETPPVEIHLEAPVETKPLDVPEPEKPAEVPLPPPLPLEIGPSPLIFRRVAAVMRAIGHIGKNRRNEDQEYSFRGIDDVYNALHNAMVDQEIFCNPRTIKREHTMRTSKNGSPMMHTLVDMEFDLITSDGSKITLGPVPGEGMDWGDKSTPKALSGSQKYALIQAFCIPTKEDKDAENVTPELGDPNAAAPRGNSRPQPRQNASRPATNARGASSGPKAGGKPDPVAEAKVVAEELHAAVLAKGWSLEQAAAFVKQKYKTDPEKMNLGQMKNMLIVLPNATAPDTAEPPANVDLTPPTQNADQQQ